MLPHFANSKGWTAWLIVIVVQCLLFMSFIDIWYFEIFKYPRNPFIIIIKENGCYKICRKKHNQRSPNFTKIMRSDSVDEETFIQ